MVCACGSGSTVGAAVVKRQTAPVVAP